MPDGGEPSGLGLGAVPAAGRRQPTTVFPVTRTLNGTEACSFLATLLDEGESGNGGSDGLGSWPLLLGLLASLTKLYVLALKTFTAVET